LLVGDAAAQIKPLSGGGLYFGVACAQIAGELAAQAARMPSGRDEILAAYPDRCLNIVGKEQAFGRTLREYASCMSDHVLTELADTLADPALLRFVADHADIDRLHELPDRLAAEPRLWGTLLQALPLLVRHSSEVP
jgi:flavin-dependent dehydrogenase